MSMGKVLLWVFDAADRGAKFGVRLTMHRPEDFDHVIYKAVGHAVEVVVDRLKEGFPEEEHPVKALAFTCARNRAIDLIKRSLSQGTRQTGEGGPKKLDQFDRLAVTTRK